MPTHTPCALVLPEVPILTTPSEGQPSLHDVLTGKHLVVDTILTRALHMCTMEEEVHMAEMWPLAAAKCSRGGAGQADDGHGGIPIPVRVAVGETQGVDICAVVYDDKAVYRSN